MHGLGCAEEAILLVLQQCSAQSHYNCPGIQCDSSNNEMLTTCHGSTTACCTVQHTHA